jgi:hypothetical protein
MRFPDTCQAKPPSSQGAFDHHKELNLAIFDFCNTWNGRFSMIWRELLLPKSSSVLHLSQFIARFSTKSKDSINFNHPKNQTYGRNLFCEFCEN